MTTELHVHCHPDMYVVTVRDSTIVRVTKYIGDTQFPREVPYEELSPAVQEQILLKVIEKSD